jgi:hypothetical protein
VAQLAQVSMGAQLRRWSIATRLQEAQHTIVRFLTMYRLLGENPYCSALACIQPSSTTDRSYTVLSDPI